MPVESILLVTVPAVLAQGSILNLNSQINDAEGEVVQLLANETWLCLLFSTFKQAFVPRGLVLFEFPETEMVNSPIRF